MTNDRLALIRHNDRDNVKSKAHVAILRTLLKLGSQSSEESLLVFADGCLGSLPLIGSSLHFHDHDRTTIGIERDEVRLVIVHFEIAFKNAKTPLSKVLPSKAFATRTRRFFASQPMENVHRVRVLFKHRVGAR